MSPIYGLTNRPLTFAEIGQIRKGGEKTIVNGKPSIGRDLDYFRVVFDENEKASHDEFCKAYGDKPKMINILLPFDDISRVWDAYLEAYTAGRMIARTDGEKFIYWVDPSTGEFKVSNSEPYTKYEPGQSVGQYISRDKKVDIYCKPVGRLHVVIPELKRLAYLTLMTGSKHDIAIISAQLEAIKTITHGKISGIPLTLKRVQRMISIPSEGGKRVRVAKWMLSIEASPKWVEAQINSMQMLSYAETAALPAGDFIDDMPETDDESTVDNYGADTPELPEPVSETIEDEQQSIDLHSGPSSVEEQKDALSPNGHTRPYEAAVLKEKFNALVKQYDGQNCTDKDRFAVRKNLEICFAGACANPSEKRYQVTEYLIGKQHIDELLDPEILALKRWLSITKDEQSGEFMPSKEAITEAGHAWTAWAEQDGRQEKLL
jgi:hypothetical protein